MVKTKNKNITGFTIVELIIVVVVIAILAALTIVAYNGIQSSARRATAMNEIDNITKQLEINKYQNNEKYASDTTGIKYSNGFIVQYTYTSATNSYCVTLSGDGVEVFKTNSEIAQDGTCPGHVSHLAGAVPAINTDWSMIATNGDTSCGLYLGSAYCWGANDYGQYGDSTTTTLSLPKAMSTSGVLSGKTIDDISVGVYNACVHTTESKMYCSGMGVRGQLGNGSVTNSSIMVEPTMTGVLSGKTINKISAGNQFVCAIASDNKAYCWGIGSSGQLGNNSTTTNNTTPLAVISTGVLSGKTITDISSGYTHTCALDSAGKAYCWGQGGQGQLGNGTISNSLVPVAVTSTGALAGKSLVKIYTGFNNACAIDTDGALYCWGQNQYGQLGDGFTANLTTPTLVPMTGLLSGKTILDVSPGSYHTCAIASDSKVYCWGNNPSGQLGNNSTTGSVSPVAVDASGALSGKTVQLIGHGAYRDFNCARASDGQIYCWGINGRGEFGNNTVSPSSIPLLTTHP